MARTGNHIIVTGIVGSVEIKPLKNGKLKVDIAVAENIKGKKTFWHKVYFFEKLAELASQFIKKGQLIQIYGRLQCLQIDNQKFGNSHHISILAKEFDVLKQNEDKKPQQAKEVKNFDVASTYIGKYLPQENEIKSLDEQLCAEYYNSGIE